MDKLFFSSNLKLQTSNLARLCDIMQANENIMKAYTQGEIDYFCGVYAIINSVRFAAAGFHKFTFHQSCEFYQHLVRWLYDRGEFLNVLDHGTSYELMDRMLAAANEYLVAKYKFRLLWTHPFSNRDLSLTRAYLFIKKYLAGDATSCLIRLDNRVVGDHWSVIENLNRPFFNLFDSYSYAGMDFRHSLWDDGLSTPTADPSATRINKNGIILIKAVKV